MRFDNVLCMLFCFVGYDSDDECEEISGMRYTRRNKGKKYAPLRKDDSLEHGTAVGTVRDKSGFGSTGANFSANGKAAQAANCSNHVNNHNKRNSGPVYSSEENGSDAEPAGQVSYVRQQHGGIGLFSPLLSPPHYFVTLFSTPTPSSTSHNSHLYQVYAVRKDCRNYML